MGREEGQLQGLGLVLAAGAGEGGNVENLREQRAEQAEAGSNTAAWVGIERLWQLVGHGCAMKCILCIARSRRPVSLSRPAASSSAAARWTHRQRRASCCRSV